MLYLIYEFEDDDIVRHHVLDGPDEADMDQLKSDFYANFDSRTLGLPRYPKYDGPFTPLQYGACSSGALPEGTPLMDMASEQYRQWDAQRRQIQDGWNRKREEKIAAYRAKYSGKDLFEMFMSYLEVEHGFKKMASKVVSL